LRRLTTVWLRAGVSSRAAVGATRASAKQAEKRIVHALSDF
jgi:hypothetical protein